MSETIKRVEAARYLIWSNEHRAWWGPGRCGYVPNAKDAGLYTREQAIWICASAIPSGVMLGSMAEVPVALADLEAMRSGSCGYLLQLPNDEPAEF